MKTIFTTLILLVVLSSCQKNTYKCVCKTSGFLTTPSQHEYTITDTERKAKKQCASGNSKADGSYISTSSTRCELY